jgi:cell wall assembly regulator SMI1
MVTFLETEKEISIEKINEIEKKLNFIFPEVYKEHLLNYNGGRCEPDVCYFEDNHGEQSSDVHWFYAIYEGKSDNLESSFRTFKLEEKRMPDSFFPFAHDSLGNKYCMDAETGKIYFWFHEDEVDYTIHDDSVRTNLIWIADSLEEFLNNLKED